MLEGDVADRMEEWWAILSYPIPSYPPPSYNTIERRYPTTTVTALAIRVFEAAVLSLEVVCVRIRGDWIGLDWIGGGEMMGGRESE